MRPSRSAGSATVLIVQSQAAPVLTIDDSDNATWTWTGTNPTHWGVYLNGSVTPGMEQIVLAGGNRSGNFDDVSGEDVVLVGVNSSFTAFQTPQSNVASAP